MPSVGIKRHHQSEIDTKEKLDKLIAAYKAQWKCKEIRVSKPDAEGFVNISEIPEIDMRPTSQ